MGRTRCQSLPAPVVRGGGPHPARVKAGPMTKYGFCLPTAAEALDLDVPLWGGHSRQAPELFLKRKFGSGMEEPKLYSRLEIAVVFSSFSTKLCQRIKCVSCGRHGTKNRVEHQGLSKSTHTCMWFHRNRICTGTHHTIRFVSFNGGMGKPCWGFLLSEGLRRVELTVTSVKRNTDTAHSLNLFEIGTYHLTGL